MLDSIKVGPFRYRIVADGSADHLLSERNHLGETDFGHLTISLNRGYPPELNRETLVHELLHVLLYQTALLAEVKDPENFCARLGIALTAFLVDNPEFLKLFA